jgi:hypothetical protein
MASNTKISAAFVLLVERCGREHGTPLPKRLLAVGNADEGWHVLLNPTPSAIDGVDPFDAQVKWNGWPAGSFGPYGGVVAAGDAANESALCEWLQSDIRVRQFPNTVEPTP